MIKIENLTLTRSGATTLDNINLSFGQGGVTALIGPNGAGKSTLLHVMAGLLAPSAGSVTISGHNMATAKAEVRARTVALLTQTDNVTARLTVEDLVTFGRWPHHQGRPTAQDRAIVDQSLELFSLTELRGRLIEALSGGQRQRAFVAMNYAQETPWMLLDEPLAALDPRHARDLMERLHDLSRPKADARSVVVVLHDLSAAARYADRVVALKDGKLVTSGPSALKFTGQMLSELFGTSLSVETLNGHRLVAGL